VPSVQRSGRRHSSENDEELRAHDTRLTSLAGPNHETVIDLTDLV